MQTTIAVMLSKTFHAPVSHRFSNHIRLLDASPQARAGGVQRRAAN